MSGPSKKDLEKSYKALDSKLNLEMQEESSIRSELLMTFPFNYPQGDTEILMDTEEFTALCPWTGLPDFGMLSIRYLPDEDCIELKSLKYYLMSYRHVGIVQEHVANRILLDLVKSCNPKKMTVILDYRIRGGLHTVVKAHFPKKLTI